MSVIVWDGKTLAADRQATSTGKAISVTKIFKSTRNNPGTLLGITGDLVKGLEMVEWFENGALPGQLPEGQRDDKGYAPMVEVRGDGSLWVYENSHCPFQVEDKVYAAGSGRDYALAALHLGRSAVEAVEVACHFDVNCGQGVNVLHLGSVQRGTPEWVAPKPQPVDVGIPRAYEA